jgi:hypothetical protein
MSHQLLGGLRAAGLLSLALMAGRPAPGAAQAPGSPEDASRLRGVVVDEVTEQPIDSAVVSLVGSDVAIPTDRWGFFTVADAPLGPHALYVSAPGHPSVLVDVEVREDRVTFVRIILPSVAAVLSELFVRSQPAASAQDNARTAADLLALAVPRTRVSSGIVGKSDYAIELRPGTTFQGNVQPMILIDGVVMTTDHAFDALQRIPASQVADIEVLRGPAAAFLYPFAASGVVLVRTKQGTR